jgi:hypothetical protein
MEIYTISQPHHLGNGSYATYDYEFSALLCCEELSCLNAKLSCFPEQGSQITLYRRHTKTGTWGKYGQM